MFVACSQFVVANGLEDEVKEAFRRRPRLVENASGFVRMDVLSPRDEPQAIWLITYWTDEPSYRVWHRSHLYHDSHAGIPKGLKVAPGRTRLLHLDHITS